jgi:hypothetical protein
MTGTEHGLLDGKSPRVRARGDHAGSQASRNPQVHLVWKSDFDNPPHYTRASILDMKALKGVKLAAGLPLAGKLPELRLEIISDYPPADYFNAGLLFIVSARLRGVLESVNALVEYHPVVLLKDGREFKESGDYYFANLLEKVDCFDFENSTYTRDGEFIDKITKLAIDEGKADDKPLFRLARSYDVIVLASDALAQAASAAGVTGVKFQALSEWKW